jgi:hypothetical protein
MRKLSKTQNTYTNMYVAFEYDVHNMESSLPHYGKHNYLQKIIGKKLSFTLASNKWFCSKKINMFSLFPRILYDIEYF